MSAEQSVASARASVMVYDDMNKKWVPSGSSSGLSKVHIYQHLQHNTFRVVGRKLHDHEVVINCSILKGLKYNQATPTFHQWRDNKQVYGLNFSSKDDADAFAKAMLLALESLNQMHRGGPSPMIQSQPISQQQTIYAYTNGPSMMGDYEDVDYQRMRGQLRDEGMVDRRMMAQPHPPPMMQGLNHSMSGPPTPATLAPMMSAPTTIPVQPQTAMPPPAPGSPSSQNAGHHRTSSAPPAPPMSHPQLPPNAGGGMMIAPPTTAGPPPPPPPPPPGGLIQPPTAVAIPPAAPPPPMNGATKAPPPPPPPPPPSIGGGGDSSSLAAALASAKLRRTSKTSEECQYGTIKGNNNNSNNERQPLTGMASMMDEMAKTLARRRAAAENYNTPDERDDKRGGSVGRTSNGNGSNNSTATGPPESPKPGRRQRFGSLSGTEVITVNGTVGDGLPYDLERFKMEILTEMRKEIGHMKQDIIDALRVELNRR